MPTLRARRHVTQPSVRPMTTDVCTTPRKPLTPRQRLKLFEDHGGICALCELRIIAGEKWRDEHMRALGLGGSNDPENRAPVHIHCAEAKDPIDMAAINKAKAVKRKALGIKSERGPKIKSAPRKPAPRAHAEREPANGMSNIARRFGVET